MGVMATAAASETLPAALEMGVRHAHEEDAPSSNSLGDVEAVKCSIRATFAGVHSTSRVLVQAWVEHMSLSAVATFEKTLRFAEKAWAPFVGRRLAAKEAHEASVVPSPRTWCMQELAA